MKISDKNKGLIPKGSVLEEYLEYDEEFYAAMEREQEGRDIEAHSRRHLRNVF